MKQLTNALAAALVIVLFLSQGSLCAQAPKKTSLPPVPITYPGDTDKTILRRAQWVEGARKEGTVIWWGNIKPEESNQIITEFNKIYPFITVTYWRGSDKERNMKLESEHAVGRLSVDVTEPGDFTTHYPRWRTIGLVEKYTDFIPEIQKIDKRMYSKYGDWAQLGNNVMVPIYNNKKVAAADLPKGWEDMLSPKWKGKIGATTDMKAWYTLALDEGGWGIEKTENFLKKLKQQELIWTAGHSAGFTLLAAGEFSLLAEGYLRHVVVAKKGTPVDWIRTPYPVVTGGLILLPKKAPHPNAARLFVEWLFSPQTALVYEKVTGKGAAYPGAGTMTSKSLTGLPLVYRTEEVVAKASELHLTEKFAEILGVTPGED